MSAPKETSNLQKNQLHSRSKHRGDYNFKELISYHGGLAEYIVLNPNGKTTIDFANADAVKALNKALLHCFYKIALWDIPEGYLCPPIPGRADYLHYLADLLGSADRLPKGKTIRVLDVGTGANCIYPLIGHKEYGWTFVGTDIDHLAIRSAKNLIEANGLSKAIIIRKQRPGSILADVIHHGERFDLTMCNPPFHASLDDAVEGTERKWKNLGRENNLSALNFGGKNSELWCEGGEQQFVKQMIRESALFGERVSWFTSLISKKDTLPACYEELKKVRATKVQTIDMSQGQKISRILVWSFR